MKSALIFSSALDGHRQVYCHVLTEVLLGQGMRVTIAGGLRHGDARLSFPYVDYYESDPRVSIVDTSRLEKGGLFINWREFAALVDQYKPDLVVIPEADNHLAMLASSVLPARRRFQGRTVGIFIRSINYIYVRPTLRETVRRYKTSPTSWQSTRRSDPIWFHESLLPRRRPLDVALCLDENYVEGHQRTHTWLPDIYKPFDEVAATFRDRDRNLWIERLDEFCERNKERFRIFYFGTPQRRRGYGALLRLASDEDACFVHCGSRNTDEGLIRDVKGIRDRLQLEGRLLETDRYIEDPVLVERFFRCTDRMVLPYQNFWGSSGVMLQSLEYGQSVLVADEGLMGWRVKKHSLGMTFANNDYEDLRSRFRLFRTLPSSQFHEPIRRFMHPFRRESLEEVLGNALLSRDA